MRALADTVPVFAPDVEASRNDEAGRRAAQRAGANQRDRTGGPQSGVKGESVSGAPAETVVPIGQPTGSDDGNGPTDTQLAIGELGLLAVALVAGFFVYRRRLPP